MIVGQNSLLNQYVPTFYIKHLVDGQGLIYDSVRKAFVNSFIAGGDGGADRLGELLNVADSVDDPLLLQNGQALVYNSSTELWENQFIDYSDIANAPIVNVPANQIVFGNSNGTGFTSDADLKFDPATNTLSTLNLNSTAIVTQFISGASSLIFRTNGTTRIIVNSNGSISIAGSTGTPGQVLTSNGPDSSPTWQPSTGGGGGGSGTVTSIGLAGIQGIIISTVSNPITTSGIFTIGLGSISPANVSSGGIVSASGNITGLNLSGTNRGDQTITLTGDASGVSTGSPSTTLPLSLATVNSNVGTFGSVSAVPVLTVDGKGRITAISTVTIGAGAGSVTSVAVTGNNGITVSGSPITTSGTFILGLGSINTAGSITGSNISGTNTGNQTITATGDATGVSTGAPATSLPLTLSTTGVSPNTYGGATQVPQFTVDSKGRISSATNIPISGISSTETVVFHYSSGSAGNFTPTDAIFSKTAGVVVTVIDGPNCIATYAFTGKANPPKSITFYGQNYSTNKFAVSGVPGPNAAQANINLDGGGTPSSPDISNGIFTSNNVLTLQTTMSFVGASSTLGNRAWLVIVFGF